MSRRVLGLAFFLKAIAILLFQAGGVSGCTAVTTPTVVPTTMPTVQAEPTVAASTAIPVSSPTAMASQSSKAPVHLPHTFTGDYTTSIPIAKDERTVMEISTTGLVEVVIMEDLGDETELQTFQAGEIPRSAKVFPNARWLKYPLFSSTGSTYYVRIRERKPGETSISYHVGTIPEALDRLIQGENLVRNEGILVTSVPYFQPVYQLVPGTIVNLEIRQGKGRVALLKTFDYLAVKNGEAKLQDLCSANPCATDSGQANIQVRLDEYEDLYIVAQPEGGELEFSYSVIATPEILNYTTTCS